MSDKIIHLSDDNFRKKILEEAGPFLIDFWAEWCGPCKMIAPILEEVSDEFKERLIVAKLNIDENSTIVSKYAIRSIPTLLLFRSGKVVATKIGLFSKKQLIEFVNDNL